VTGCPASPQVAALEKLNPLHDAALDFDFMYAKIGHGLELLQ
jgi:hypothetical protein